MSDAAGDWSDQTAPPERVPNHLVWAILSTLFCCQPLGIVSLVYAAQVDTKQAFGDMAGARITSDNAKKWAIASTVVALVVYVLPIVLIILTGAFAGLSGQFN
jgi:hypothetical protein